MIPSSCTSPPNRLQENAWPNSWISLMITNAARGIPRLRHRARAVEQSDEAVRRGGEAVVLVARRIAHDVPALAAIVLARDLRAGAKACAKVGDAIPGFVEGGS